MGVSFAVASAAAAALVAASSFGSAAATVPFTRVVVDASNPGNPHTKAAGDIDGDGFPDLLAGSSVGDGLFWYAYPAWTKHRIATGSFTTDMQVGDVDGDGDLDAVIPDGGGVVWFENPRPAAPPTGTWARRLIGVDGAANHDVEVGDVNRDGRLDVVSRQKTGGGTYLWLQNAGVTWTRVVVTTRSGEGTALGDLDGDGDLDIVQNGFWLQTPGNPATGTWVERFVASGWPADVGATVADIDANGRNDIVLAPSESPGRISWYSAADPVNGPWVEHSVDPDTSYIHTLKTGDVDLDGDLDIVGAEMHQSVDPDEVNVYVNGGGGASWTQQVVDVTGSHNIRLVDIGSDGDLDIYGANWNDGASNSAVIEYWRNDLQTRFPLDRWQRHVIDSAKPWRSIFVDSGDLDRDGLTDVVTGGWWYRNPGSSGTVWERRTLGSPLNNMAAVLDADADGDLDVLGTQGIGDAANANFAWARNDGTGAFAVLQNVESGNGNFLQGVAHDRFRAGGPLEVALSWHAAGAGVQALTLPANPSVDPWRWRLLSSVSQNEQLSSADVDRDGDRDLVLGTKWLRQDAAAWTPLDIRASADEPDRNRVADVNGDGRLDVVVGFESSSPQGKVAWYEQPATLGGAWVEHVIATVVGPLSLDVADMDRDGDVDAVVGEHNLANPGSARLFVYENADRVGGLWTQHVASVGDEHHDGAHVVDLDRDGDLDVVSIGWNHSDVVWYENRAILDGFPPPPPPPPATAPVNRSPPTISGNAQVGATLTSTAGSWSGQPPPSFAYEWRRCDAAGAGCVATGATGTSYTLVPADAGSTLRVAVTGSNAAGSATAVSAQTAVVAESSPPPPPGEAVPTVGLRAWFRADRGVLALDGASVSSWADESGSGANAGQAFAPARPSLVAGAVNGLPAVRFDGVNDFLTFSLSPNGLSGMTLVLVSSNRVDRDGTWNGVGYAPLFWNETASWGTVHLSPFQSRVRWRFGTGQPGNLPVRSRPTSIGSSWSLTTAVKSGTSESLFVGGQLVAAQSGKLATIQGIRSVGNLGRGYNDDTFFPGEIAEVLVYDRALSAAERGGLEQYLLAKYFASQPPLPPATAPVNTGPPTISGSARVGATLTASPGSWTGDPPPSFEYQWRRCDAAGEACGPIAGTTGTSYTLASADAGSTLRVAVTGSNSAGSSTAVSAQTVVVQEPGDTVVYALGDGADGSAVSRALADYVAAQDPDRFFYLGDVYETGTAAEFAANYEPLYGSMAARTDPVLGNHESGNRSSGYYPYWMSKRGWSEEEAKHRSYVDTPSGWQVIAYSSEETNMAAEAAWVAGEVAKHAGTCRIVMAHKGRHVVVDTVHDDITEQEPVWAQIVGKTAINLVGHNHIYGRLAPIEGVTVFVSGAGGHTLRSLGVQHHTVVASRTGIATATRLVLRSGAADFSQVDANGTVHDSGTVTCTPPPPPPPPDTTPPSVGFVSPVEGQTLTGTVTVEAQASDDVGVAGVRFEVDGAALGAELTAAPYRRSLDTTTLANGSHVLRAVARDAAGNTASAQVSVTVDNPPADGTTPPSAGLAFWVRADDGIATMDGASVSGWSDRSEAGRSATQPFGPAQPRLVPDVLNGKPVVRFDGVNDFMSFDLPLNGLSALTLVLVSASNSDGDGGWHGVASAPLFWNETAPWGTVHLSPFQSRVKWRFGTGQAGNLPVWVRPASIGSAWSLTTAVKEGTQESLYVGGQLVATQSGKLATIQGIRPVGNLGRGYDDDSFFAGDIAEVLVYDRALSTAERGQLEQYVLAKYFGG